MSDFDDIPMLNSIEELPVVLESMNATSFVLVSNRHRPYNGQPWTDEGQRGKTEVKGLTMRDIRDCFIRACYLSSGLPSSEYPLSVYQLPWNEMDIIAVSQNLVCELEKRMGIFPNIPDKDKTP